MSRPLTPAMPSPIYTHPPHPPISVHTFGGRLSRNRRNPRPPPSRPITEPDYEGLTNSCPPRAVDRKSKSITTLFGTGTNDLSRRMIVGRRPLDVYIEMRSRIIIDGGAFVCECECRPRSVKRARTKRGRNWKRNIRKRGSTVH